MLIKHMAACLVATALVAAPALAQSPTAGGTDRPAASDNRTGTLGSPAMNAPGTSAPSASSGTTSPGNSTTGAGAGAAGGMAGASGTPASPPPSPPPAGSPPPPPAGGSTADSSTTSGSSTMAGGSSMQQLQPGQFLASDLIGTRVVGQNNEAIGDVNDVVMGQDGKAMAVLVGVGGFLGIGEKDVAIPFEQAKVMYDSGEANQTGSTGTTGSTGGAASGGSGSNAAGSASGSAGQQPQRIMVSMSKEQLQQAPAFRTSNDAAASGNTGASGSSTTGTPRQ